MKLTEIIAALTDNDKYLLCLCLKNGKKIETKCVTKSFPHADILIAKGAIIENINNIEAKTAPVSPKSLN